MTLKENNFLKKEINLFFIALGFLTRLPVPKKLNFSQKNLNQASRYFSLIGWLIGLINMGTFLFLSFLLPVDITIIFCMLTSVIVTGCFHEDGLADTCDGLGGGWSQQQKLAIMKDSRLGTYGTAALWFVLSIKFLLLSHLPPHYIAVAFLIAHPMSRSFSTALIFILPYVTQDENSKVKSLVQKQNIVDLVINLFIGLLSFLLVINMNYKTAFILFLALVILLFMTKSFLSKQIQGVTGDALGASQQIAEVMTYLVLLIGSIHYD